MPLFTDNIGSTCSYSAEEIWDPAMSSYQHFREPLPPHSVSVYCSGNYPDPPSHTDIQESAIKIGKLQQQLFPLYIIRSHETHYRNLLT